MRLALVLPLALLLGRPAASTDRHLEPDDTGDFPTIVRIVMLR